MKIYDVRKALSNGKTIYDMPLRVTHYARVSTVINDQLNSLQNQIDFFEDYIGRNENWQLVDGYIDEGLSGTSVNKRESFLKMVRDAKDDKFDLIITKEISRFARNTMDSITYTQELLRNDVGVFFLSDNINTYEPDSELRLTIMSSLVQEEVRKISGRVKFGHKQAIKKGRVLGNDAIWGYKKNDGKLEILDKEAEIVRLIFDTYVNGYGINTIAEKLFQKGMLNHSENKFTYNTIRNILTNPKYKGYYVGNKSEKIDYRHNKRVFFKKEEWDMYEASADVVPAIVDEETWEKANALFLERSQKQSSNDKTSYNDRSVYSGKIICMEHGTSYWRNIYKYKSGNKECWQCKEYRRGGKAACSSPMLYTDEINDIVGGILKELITGKDKIIAQLLDTYSKVMDNNDFSNELQSLNDKLTKVNVRKDKLLDLYMDAALSKQEFQRRNNEMNIEVESFEKQIEKILALKKKQTNTNEELLKIRKAIEHNLNFDSTTDNSRLIAAMLERIEIHPKEENGVSRLDIILNIGANIPTLDLREYSNIKKNGSKSSNVHSVPIIHMIRADIETEVSPIVGTEKQSEELIHYLLNEFDEEPTKIWKSNIFGKSLSELVNEGLHNKLDRMPEDAQYKLQETLQRIINEGSGGLICIIL